MDEDLVLDSFRQSLSPENFGLLDDHFNAIADGDFFALLAAPQAKSLFSEAKNIHAASKEQENVLWTTSLREALNGALLKGQNDATLPFYILLGYASLLAFLQTTITGPPLPFSPATILFGDDIANHAKQLAQERSRLADSLSVDGIGGYKLATNIELFCLARAIITSPSVTQGQCETTLLRLRTTFVHQRLLSEPSSSLQEDISGLLDQAQAIIELRQKRRDGRAVVAFSLEKASIETYYHNDSTARTDIAGAAAAQGFEFVLTGRLGKRTKFQQRDVSQLVVLARSRGEAVALHRDEAMSAPQKLDLNDDTLLESISFSKEPADVARIVDEASIPKALAALDPADQPQLAPWDSIILLSLASAITNTSPADGLTREETLPYAERVLGGGSSNWQIYTQALLVRSRIEGYKSRTVERGLLQLQALVDQVIVETGGQDEASTRVEQSSFLPRPKESESAPAAERLKYIFQLATPLRWELEAELAQRWVQLGGLRSALDIYERLEMWAEAALCWAATEREDKAKSIIRRLLFLPSSGSDEEAEDETWDGPVRDPLPADAPRLLCILGDIDQDPSMYEKAWEVSNQHYARAQRSLGRLCFGKRDYLGAAAAYSKSLNVNKLNQSSWFALGCALLELEEYGRAAESFTRCVQLDERDAEAWSNLAAALLRKGGEERSASGSGETDDLESAAPKMDDQKAKLDALRALKRAASLKHDSYRIWENVLIVASSLNPPDLNSAIAAQSRIIDLQGATVGEKCVDAEIMALLVRETIASSTSGYDAGRPGAGRLMVELFDRKIQPLITASTALWSLVAKLALWRGKPGSALAAHEKAWRVVLAQPGWDDGSSEKKFAGVVDGTIELCDAYESLGPRDATEGLAAGQAGALVAKDWRFKARSALRSVLGRAKDSYEGTEGWDRLKRALDGLKG